MYFELVRYILLKDILDNDTLLNHKVQGTTADEPFSKGVTNSEGP